MVEIFLAYFILYLIAEAVWERIYGYFYRAKINKLLDCLSCKEDFLYMRGQDFIELIALMFLRKGHKVEQTDKCGETSGGLIIDDVTFVEMSKNSLNHLTEKETAMKLSRCMREASIYRGMLITSGDYRPSARLYCRKNVIECINGDTLFDMCKRVQKPLALAGLRE